MKIIWSTEGVLQFLLIREKGHQLKYLGKVSTYTHGTLCAIPLGFLHGMVKRISHKPNFHSKRLDIVYPDHVNTLCEADLASPIFPEMGEICKNQDEKRIFSKKMALL